jgi:hypothetical protein
VFRRAPPQTALKGRRSKTLSELWAKYSGPTPGPRLRRATPADFGIDKAMRKADRAWAASLPPPDLDPADLDEKIFANVIESLPALGVRKSIINTLRRLDPVKWYVAWIVFEDYDADENNDERPGDSMTSRRSLPFYGTGLALVRRVAEWAVIRTIVSVRVREAKPPKKSNAPDLRPLYAQETIRLMDGSTAHGRGRRRMPTRRKPGPPRKNYGSLTHAQGRKRDDAQRKRDKRAAATAARMAHMTPAERKRYQRKIDAQRKSHPRKK